MHTIKKYDKICYLFVALLISAIPLFLSSPISNATAQSNVTAQAEESPRPTDAYDTHAVGTRHIYGSPEMEAHFYCKMNEDVLATCQIYDSNSQNASLIGVEYIISAEDFNSLPEEDKPNWYVINESLAERTNLRIPEISPEESAEALSGLLGTYGKLILTWNPDSLLPSTLPQLVDLHNRELVNPTNDTNTS